MKKFNRIFPVVSCALLLLAGAADAAGFKPNVMILLDSSGSMGETVQALPDYVRSTSYANCVPGNYATAKVYQYDTGSYVEYAASIVAVSSAPIEAALTARGFWFGNLGSSSMKLFHGNYLNYEFCSSLTPRTKLAIAKSVINTVIGAIPDKRFGAMQFNSNNNGGTVVATIGTATTTIAAAVNGIVASGRTPLGPQLRDAGYYFEGGFGYATPIQGQCQQNSVFIISDGAENVGPPWVVPQAASEYGRDHSTAFSGTQNLITNTVSFYLNPTTDRVAISSLTSAAAAGGGTYVSANDPAQLSQAFFQIPPGIALTAPLPNSIVAGNILLSVGVGNAACITSVQFKVDGVDKGAPITAAPYNYTWNSNTVTNGTHTVTAVMMDSDGNANISFPALITTSNDQTPPMITSVDPEVWQTSATVNWTTNEASDSQVWYSTSVSYTSYTNTPLVSDLVTAHSQLITGLTPFTEYQSSVTSRDAAGNLAVFHTSFITKEVISPGVLDHFKLNFGNAQLPGPGLKTGNYPYALTAGDCYGLTIEAVDNLNRHNNLTDDIAVSLYSLDDYELEVSLVPGISSRDNYQLGVSSMVLHMVNGYVFLGSETDQNKQVCFYRATQAPGSYKQSGAPGDLHLKVVQVSAPAITGISASFIVWPGYANGIALLAPDRTLVPATPTGVTGALVDQNQGTPFPVRAYLVDRYFNNARTNTDTLRFTSSLPGQTGFVPFEGKVSDGLLISSVTVDACGAPLTLSVQNLTSPSLANGQVTVNMAACGSAPPGPGFYQVAVPGLVRAGDPFGVTITIKNVTRPIGAGSLKYVGNLVPLVPLDLTHYTYASGHFTLPTFEFDIPDGWNGGVMGDYIYTLNNQSYNRSEIVWMQLIGTGPAELKDATAIGGPMQVLPANPHRLTASATPNIIGPLSSTQIKAKLLDIYGNGVPNVALSALITQGTGDFNVADIPSTSLTVQTDEKGEINIPFISHRNSETDKVRIWVPNYPDISTILTISITLIGDKTVAVYPNPTKITERPAVIEYRLDYDSEVELLVTNAFGHEVWRKSFPPGAPGGLAGYNTVEWNGRNGAGEQVAVGIYGLHLRITANSSTKDAKTRFGIMK